MKASPFFLASPADGISKLRMGLYSTSSRVAVKDEPRNYADKIRRFYRDASDILTELSRGSAESYSGEQEDCWARMALAHDELREMGII